MTVRYSKPRTCDMQRTTITTTPPKPPPSLPCPSCRADLRYRHSYVSGMPGQRGQWDAFFCESCGPFEYYQRSQQLRRVDGGIADPGRP